RRVCREAAIEELEGRSTPLSCAFDLKPRTPPQPPRLAQRLPEKVSDGWHRRERSMSLGSYRREKSHRLRAGRRDSVPRIDGSLRWRRPGQDIVLVHGAWVDASGWNAVYESLTREGFNVFVVQEPETSFADDVAATKRVLDLQHGPTLLVGHSYGGSIITEAGVHPSVAGLVHVAAHAPDVGENESALGRNTP